jgi:hypothetical protein
MSKNGKTAFFTKKKRGLAKLRMAFATQYDAKITAPVRNT